MKAITSLCTYPGCTREVWATGGIVCVDHLGHLDSPSSRVADGNNVVPLTPLTRPESSDLDDIVKSAYTVRASDVVPEAIEWLWQGYVPIGMTTVMGGFPGVGKSTILYDLAARASREGSPVLVVTAEDHLAAVARPRLEAARADLDIVRFLTVPLSLPEDTARLAELVAEFKVRLVILDPLVAFIGDGVNTHRDHHVRRVLAPLSTVAEQARVALVVVIHTNKGTGSEPLMRISGSIGFTGAARTVLLAADDPQDDGRRILGVVKSNLAELSPPLAYRIQGATVAEDIPTSRVEWLGEAPEVDMRELLTVRDPEERSAREEAVEFLRASGVMDTARTTQSVEAEAKSLGIGEKTVQRARRQLGIPVWKDGFPGTWYWGPRPNEAPTKWTGEVDTPTLSVSSSSGLPAETVTLGSEVDTPQGCPDCGGMFGHMVTCPRSRL